MTHEDTFPIRKVDHVRHYVNNARQAAFFYQQSFGFHITGYYGLETGCKDECGYVLEPPCAQATQWRA
jgi:4-hydroxyphenylpyruvate dioxygenase